jgi:site-specific recombinase XerD
MAKYVSSLAAYRKAVKASQNADHLSLCKCDVNYLAQMLKRYDAGLNYTDTMRDEINRIAAGERRRQTDWAITPDKFLSESKTEHMLQSLARRHEEKQSVNSLIDFLIIKLLLTTGLRNSELCSLRVDQTSFVQHPDEEPTVWVKGKGGKLRTVVIPRSTAELIEYYVKNVRPQLLPKHVRKNNYKKPLLYSIRKRPYSRAGLWSRVRAIGNKIHLATNLYPHKLRHTLATVLYRNTKDLQMVQAQLGHSNINTTTIYAALDRAKIFGSIESLDILRVNVRVFNTQTITR